MKNVLFLALLLTCGTSYAGTRDLTLSCDGAMGIADGAIYEGSGGRKVVVHFNTEKKTAVDILSTDDGPSMTVKTEALTSSPMARNFFKGQFENVILFTQSNCMKGSVSAILTSGKDQVWSCAVTDQDQMNGSDYDFCK